MDTKPIKCGACGKEKYVGELCEKRFNIDKEWRRIVSLDVRRDEMREAVGVYGNKDSITVLCCIWKDQITQNTMTIFFP